MDNEIETSLLEANAENNKLSKKVWKESKAIVRIAIPAMVSRVTAFGVLVVTQSCMGYVSSVELAGYSLVQSITVGFFNGIVLGMSSATETLCGQAFGARQYHMMGIYLQRSWIVNFVTITILLPVFIFASPMYELLGEKAEISIATASISLWFIPVIYTYGFAMTIQMFLQAQMKNIIIGYISAVTFVLHLFLSWLFVYKLNLGIPGAMGVMIISRWLLVFGEWIYIFGGWCTESWRGFSKLAFADLGPVIKLSISSGFMICLELWYNSILVLIAGYSKNAVVEVSAFSICLNVNLWEFMIVLGFLATASVRVSNELGRGNIEDAKLSIKVLLCMAVALGICCCLLCIIFGHSYPYLFTSDVEVVEAASNLSSLLALTMLVSSFQAIFSGIAIGCGSQGKVAIVNLVCYYAIGIPVGCLLAFVANLGIKGIWIGMLIGMVIQITTLAVITWKIDWNEEANKTKRRLKRFYHESNQYSDPA